MIDQAQALLAYRLAMSQLAIAAKDLAAASRRVSDAAHAWDPQGEKDDAGVLALAETTEQLLLVAASSSPGLGAVFASVVERLGVLASEAAGDATETKGDASEA